MAAVGLLIATHGPIASVAPARRRVVATSATSALASVPCGTAHRAQCGPLAVDRAPRAESPRKESGVLRRQRMGDGRKHLSSSTAGGGRSQAAPRARRARRFPRRANAAREDVVAAARVPPKSGSRAPRVLSSRSGAREHRRSSHGSVRRADDPLQSTRNAARCQEPILVEAGMFSAAGWTWRHSLRVINQ